ncbi:MAG: hypothetical protein HYR85_14485 [Planctomycetes bacterium]|nr:hypothetical protein [Planctomycetota bacterium]MBI3845553.1 hypothetical protein [Planctomycetota bacterium]
MSTVLRVFAWVSLWIGVSLSARAGDFAKLSPFSAVRWRDAIPEVQVGATWFELVSMNGLSRSEIVDFCRERYGERWIKRFEEDLVEVLTTMGHPPGKTAALKLRDLATGAESELPAVPMTEGNRRAIWEAAQRRLTGGDSNQPRLSAEQARTDLDALEFNLEHRYSYLKRRGVDWRPLVADVRRRSVNGIARDEFGLRLVKLLAAFGDGHSQIEDALAVLPRGFAPYLVGESGERLVAFNEDRSGFVDAAHPFLERIDGVDVKTWLDAASRIVAQGSAGYVRHHAVRNLRYVGWLRRETGMPNANEIELTLGAADGKDVVIVKRPLSATCPTYGEWPRAKSRVLAGNVGYLRIPEMTDDAAAIRALLSDLERLRDAKGLVIDVRGNGGGSRDILRALFPFFMRNDDPPQVANVAAYRLDDGDDPDRSEGFLADRELYPLSWSRWSATARVAIGRVATSFAPEWAPPKGEFSAWHYFVLERAAKSIDFVYDRPVVVLLNEDCFSATDIFIGAFAGWRNVTLVGTPSGGGSGRTRSIALPNSGLRVRLSTMASYRTSGRLYDGNGTDPDVRIDPAPTDWLGTTDTVLDAALTRLR